MELKSFYLNKLKLPFIKYIKTMESIIIIIIIILILMKNFLYKSDNIYLAINFFKYFLCMELKFFYLNKLKLPFIKFIKTMESIIIIIFNTHEIFPCEQTFFKKNIFFARN